MNHPAGSQSTETSNDLRKMGKLARTYAQNRSLGVVVSLLIFLILSAAIGGSSYFGGMAYRYSQWPIFWLCMAILVIAMAATGCLSTPQWGGKMIERLTARLYSGEGKVQLSCPMSGGRKLVGWCLMATFFVCILATAVLGFLDVFPEKYMQPVSAIYLVPFLVILWLLMRPMVGPIALLWPALYTLHAVLILIGVPILFTGPWDPLNMLIPTVGYGLIASLIAHIYSRIMLRRLRCMTRGNLSVEEFEETRP
jgi:hypothetical protein